MECLRHTAHRPYPLPESGRIGRQNWEDLAFFHWRVPADCIRDLLPRGLELDSFDGEAWLSVVPFRISDVMLRGLPAIPGLSHFPELNLRTYVVKDGKPGVWFFSLDADQRIAVWAARKFYHLPYFKASMRCEMVNGEIQYSSKRSVDGASFRASYRPVGEVYAAQKGTLEHWLTERYCLYAADADGQLFRAEVHHKPWPLQHVQYTITENGVGKLQQFDFHEAPDLAQFSRFLEVAIWPPELC